LTKELSNLSREHWGCCFSFDKDCLICPRSGPHVLNEEDRESGNEPLFQTLLEENIVAKTIFQHAPTEHLNNLNNSLSSFITQSLYERLQTVNKP